METLFIADLHLQTEKSIITTSFLHFLQNEALAVDALYILGDLFESWIGDDDPNPLHYKIAAAIKSLVNSGIPCYFIHGNRDFLIGRRFSKESGMTLLPEKQVLNLYGHKILIMHGDTLCTDDIKYQRFRTKVHKPWIQRIFLSLPLFIRIRIAAKLRANSSIAGMATVNQQAVIEVMKKYQVQWLICGHTHHPYVYKFTINDKSAFCVVLGMWNSEGSIVKVTSNGVELLSFHFT